MAVTKDSGFPVTAHDASPNAHDLTWPAFTTPGTNRVVVAMYLANGPVANAISTFTSPNLTWTRAIQEVDSGNNYRAEIWTAFAASVVTSEVISSVDTGGATYGTRSMVIFSFNGSDSSGIANATGTGTGTGSPSLAVTATGSGSYLLAGFPYRSAGNDVTIDANTTSEYNAGNGGGFGFNERAGSRTSSGAGALTLGWNSNTPFAWSVIAGLEVKTGGPVTVTASAAIGSTGGLTTGQIAVPIRDINSNGWTTDTGATTNLYQAID